MTDKDKEREEKVFDQELSAEELNGVAGGSSDAPYYCSSTITQCKINKDRNIYVPSFPNCAATVEDGSWCDDNDACYDSAVKYHPLKNCSKAWR